MRVQHRTVEGGEILESHDDEEKHAQLLAATATRATTALDTTSGEEGSCSSLSTAGGKRYWSAKEDNQLRALVDTHGARRWPKLANLLAEALPDLERRTASQCRDRWLQHLDPSICRDPVSREELAQILVLQKEYGNRWTQIAKRLGGGRTGLQVKNAWQVRQRQRRRALARARHAATKAAASRGGGTNDTWPPKKRYEQSAAPVNRHESSSGTLHMQLKSRRRRRRQQRLHASQEDIILESPTGSPRKTSVSAFDTLRLVRRLAHAPLVDRS